MTSSTTPPAAPGGTRRARRGGRAGRRVLIGFVALFLVLGLVGSAAYLKLQGNIASSSLGPHVVKDDTPKGAENILFIGSDTRKLKEKGYGNEAGQRSDALMLVHFSKGNTRIDAVQIPRDTLTVLPSCPDTGSGAFAGGTNLMINSALAGGPACSVRAVEKISGVHIDHFAQLDFDGFASMVNALGGVNVCLDKPMYDADAKLNLPAGKQKIDGKNALALARTRHAVGDGSDIGRLGHQQVVMSSIISRARSAGVLTRPDRLFKFLNALTKSITVDKGISSISKLTGLAKRARAVPDKDIRFITMPNGAAPSDPNRVVKTSGADTIFAAIAKDQKVPVESSASESSTTNTPVKVLNASGTPGLAVQGQSALTREHFVVSSVAEAQKAATATRIFVDSTPEALKTAQALNKKFGFNAQIVEQPSGVTGAWLIVGSDRVTEGFASVTPDPVQATTRTASGSLCT